MREEEWRKIRAHFKELIDELELVDSKIIDYLITSAVLTSSDRERIETRVTREDRNRKFFDILQTKDDDAYRHFKDAVAEYTPWISKYLQPAGSFKRSQAGGRVTGQSRQYGGKAIGDLSSEELKDWLRPKLEKESLPPSILETVLEEEIDGHVFENLTEENLKELFSGLKFGQRKKLLLLKQEAAGRPVDHGEPNKGFSIPLLQRTEFIRRFGQEPQISEKYHQGKILNKHEARAGSLMNPVRQFFSCTDESDSPSIYDDMADKVVLFAAACLNDRQNGTVYFGIGEQDCEQYCYGQVLGFPFDKKGFEDAVTLCVKRRFCGEAEIAAALKCIKPPVFLDVVPIDSNEGSDLYVCEVDVEPRSNVVKDLDFFLNIQSDVEGDNQVFYRFDASAGTPRKQNQKQLKHFCVEKPELDKERQQQEKSRSAGRQKKLMQTLKDCLCGGGDKLDGNFYPLLISPHVNTAQAGFGDSFKFIFDIDWRGIFDFDPESDDHGLYNYLVTKAEKVYKVKTTEDFLPASASAPQSNTNNPEEHFQGIIESRHETWIFCNGYTVADEEGMDVVDWKRKRRRGFREAVEFFKRNIPLGRAVVVIMLSSSDDVLIEASEELLLSFEHQWLAVAESEQIAEAWIDGLLKRDVKVDRERCLFGFPFSDISKAIYQLQGLETTSKDVCVVKSSSGLERQLSKIMESELCDLDIISSRQCCTADSLSEEESSKLSKDTEEEFYKGNQPSFWNFYFEGHVLKRDKYPDLLDYTKETLKDDVPDKGNVGCVAVYHQPGAGGTTVAMNVLWDLHSEYTCCMPRQITSETAQQILTLYEFSGSSPDDRNPVLLLLDNEDDEKIDELKRAIDDECDSRGIQTVVCVFLLCFRRLFLPQDHEHKNIILLQSVSVREKRFFLDKYHELKRNGKGQASLDSLLGLNIMKENFNEEYILRTVSTFVQAFQTGCERTLLKYIALLNSFDLSFRAIPISCFDPLMQHSYTGKGPWEGNLTPQPLLTYAGATRMAGRNKCLRVTSKLLCKYILDVTLGKRMSVGELMEEFLHSRVFKRRSEDVAFKDLVVIVKDLMKKREWVEQGRRSTFSPFIQMLFENNEYEQAVSCIQLVYENAEDPVLAQQLARFHICCQKWEAAEEWAEEATRKRPSSSYMWDTHGQVYRCRLAEIRDGCEASHEPPNASTIEDAVICAHKGFEIFSKVQELSRYERVIPPNAAGYFGQMDVIVLLIKILKNLPCFQSMEALHAFLEGGFPPGELHIYGLQGYIPWLQTLIDRSNYCMRSVEDMVDLYPSEGYGQSSSKVFLSSNNLHRYATEFSDLFSEDDPMAVDPQQRTPEGRQRLVRKLGGNSLYSVMNLHRLDDGKERVGRILHISSLNLHSGKARNKRYDLSMALASALTLSSFHDDSSHPPVSYSTLLKWSLELYNLKEETQYLDLDPFIYLLVFHWPMHHRQKLPDQCDAAILVNATKLAHEAFAKKFQKDSGSPKKNLPMYFLTKIPGIRSVVSKGQLQIWSDRRRGQVTVNRMMKGGKAINMLERFKGILLRNGFEVKVTMESSQGHKMEVRIPLFTKHASQTLWNKKVYFVLGFGSGGPIACDVSAQLPQQTQPVQAPTGPSNFGRPSRPAPAFVRVDCEIELLRQRLFNISRLQRKQALTPQEMQDVRELPRIYDRLRYLQAMRQGALLHNIP